MAMKIILALIVVYGLISIVDAFSASGWTKAHATFYGGSDASGTMGGACGIICDYNADSRWCLRGKSQNRHATNFCPPNFAQASDNGGWCNPPLQHFDMAQPAWEKIGIYRGGIVPVYCSKGWVPCKKHGGVRFTINGRDYFELVLVSNVGGSGSIQSVSIKGSKTDGDNVKELGS
ncbi:hypothetical protein IFM89_010194 [Coptis chinensis]|uniref:Expansin n=1 Tax=Coptis chinensis TaxID=261450 RepID=A0A835GXQ5_9MAGN|nr:hypothetical protein IFM89_010194 [Coptis chinensis]